MVDRVRLENAIPIIKSVDAMKEKE